MTVIAPCPVCGCRPKVVREPHIMKRNTWESEIVCLGPGGFHMVSMRASTTEAVVAAWNKAFGEAVQR